MRVNAISLLVELLWQYRAVPQGDRGSKSFKTGGKLVFVKTNSFFMRYTGSKV